MVFSTKTGPVDWEAIRSLNFEDLMRVHDVQEVDKLFNLYDMIVKVRIGFCCCPGLKSSSATQVGRPVLRSFGYLRHLSWLSPVLNLPNL